MSNSNIGPTRDTKEWGKNRKADARRLKRGKGGRRDAIRDARSNG